MAKQVQTPTDVVRCEWSGNRANAWDTNGVKRTSEITVGASNEKICGIGFKRETLYIQYRKEGQFLNSAPITNVALSSFLATFI